MRSFLLLLLSVLLAQSGVFAQGGILGGGWEHSPDSRLGNAQRLNLDRTFGMQNLNVGNLKLNKGTSTKSFATKGISNKSFTNEKRYSARDFQTGRYAMDKSCWMGDFRFDASKANVAAKTPFRAGSFSPAFKTAPIAKAVPVRSVNDARKPYEGLNHSVRDYRGAGAEYFRSEAALDRNDATADTLNAWRGQKKLSPRSMEELRKLLNTNR